MSPHQSRTGGRAGPARRAPAGHRSEPKLTSPAVSPTGTRTMIRFCLRAMIRAGIPLNAAQIVPVML